MKAARLGRVELFVFEDSLQLALKHRVALGRDGRECSYNDEESR